MRWIGVGVYLFIMDFSIKHFGTNKWQLISYISYLIYSFPIEFYNHVVGRHTTLIIITRHGIYYQDQTDYQKADPDAYMQIAEKLDNAGFDLSELGVHPCVLGWDVVLNPLIVFAQWVS